MQEPEFLIDPNDLVTFGEGLFENGSLEHENLVKYAELTVRRRGRSVINGTLGSLTSNAEDLSVNFLGFDPKTNNYTTNYTGYMSGSAGFNESDGYSNNEGFGMTDISVKISASYIASVTITFVDVRSLALMNDSANSPYSVLFDMPPPVFRLKLKGYFGKPIILYLHKLKENIKTDSKTGNTIITLNLTSNRYAPLTDILSRHLMAVPFLEGRPVNTTEELTEGKTPESFYEFVQRAKSLLTSVGSFKTDDDLITKILDAEYKISLADKLKEKLINVKQDYFFDDPTVDVTYLPEEGDKKDTIIISTLAENSIVSVIDVMMSDFKERYNSISSTDPNLYYVQNELVNAGGDPIKEYIIDIKSLSDSIGKYIEKSKDEKLKSEKEAETNINELAIQNIGGIPTIRFVFDIIAKDMEKFLAMIAEVSIRAEEHHKNPSVVSRFMTKNKSTEGVNGKLYPWPTFVEQTGETDISKPTVDAAKQQYIGKYKEFSDFPEVEFVERFVNALLKVENTEEVLPRDSRMDDQSLVINNQWIPNGTIDSEFNDVYSNQYIGSTIQDIFLRIFSRLIMSINHSFDIDKQGTIKQLAKIEANNIIAALQNETLINRIIQISRVYREGNISDLLNENRRNGEIGNNVIGLFSGGLDEEVFNGVATVRDHPDFKGILSILNTDQGRDFSISFSASSRNNITEFLSDKEGFSRGFQSEGYLLEDKNVLFFPDKTLDVNGLMSDFLNGTLISHLEHLSVDDSGFFKDNTLRAFSKNYVKNKDIQVFLSVTMVFKEKTAAIDFFLLSNKFSEPGVVQIPKLALLNMGALIHYQDHPHLYNELGDRFKPPMPEGIDFLSHNDREILKGFYIDFYNDWDNQDLKWYFDRLVDYGTKDIDFSSTALKAVINNHTNRLHGIMYPYYLVNSTYKTFSPQNPDNDRRYVNILGLGDEAQSFFKNLFQVLGDGLDKKIKKEQKEKRDHVIKKAIEDNDLKLSIYNMCKSIYDRWIAGDNINIRQLKDTNGRSYSGYYPFIGQQDPKLIDTFSFIDRGHNDIGDKLILDLSPLINFAEGSQVNLFALISETLGKNQILFYPLISFMQFNNDEWKNSFRMTTDVSDESNSSPAFVCMYVGGYSSVLNQRDNGYTSDAMDITNPEDQSTLNVDTVKAFRVSFGKSNQSMFKSLLLDSAEFKETGETLTYMDRLIKSEAAEPVAKAQNLFNLYSQRSYTCKLISMGNYSIQPTQYFQVENIPMFNGSYLIYEVETNMDYQTVETIATGVRVSKYPVSFVQKFASLLSLEIDDARGEYLRLRKANYSDSDGTDPGTASRENGINNISLGSGSENYSFIERTNIQINGPFAAEGIRRNIIDFIENKDRRYKLNFGLKGGYCQGWVSRVMDVAGLRLTPYPISAWNFFAGLPLSEIVFLYNRKSVIGENKHTNVTNEEYQTMGVEDGSLVFGFFNGSKYKNESISLFSGTDKETYLKDERLFTPAVSANNLEMVPITHVGIYINGSFTHLVGRSSGKGDVIQTSESSSFTPIAYVPFIKHLTN